MTETEITQSAESGSTELTRFNALKHGVLSRYTVLPWEDAAEYRDLVAALPLNMRRKVRLKNTSSRNWPASSGENVG